MKPIASLAAVSLLTVACVPRPQPSPPVQPRSEPAPTPTPPRPTPAYANWMDVPATPGNWSFREASGVSTAFFSDIASPTLFSMRCDAGKREIVLSRWGRTTGQSLTVRTETQTRTIAGAPSGMAIEGRVPASDRLLDAIALSKGRFVVEAPGAPTLYLPSWAEVTRVIEDCR